MCVSTSIPIPSITASLTTESLSNNAEKQPVFKELHATTKGKNKVLILELLILSRFSCNNGIFSSKVLSSDYYSKESGMQHITLQHT